MSRRPVRAVQLQLDFAPLSHLLSSDELRKALVRRGCRRLAHVRFKKNRGRIISLSKDGRTLHIHACFQEATDEALSAVVTFLKAGRRSYAYREAIRAMREFFDAHASKYVEISPEAEDHRLTQDVQRLPCVGTAQQRGFLREAYSRFNTMHFGSRLPWPIQIRLSDRMKSRLGHVRYHTTSTGERVVLELALNVHLLLAGNEAALLDTLLHEMTHIDAWLEYGERAHGRQWKLIANRVGCEATACSTQPIHRRRKRVPIVDVPAESWLPEVALLNEGSAA